MEYEDLEFDEEKYYLGDLCIRGHDWMKTGHSLRYHTSGCVQCAKERMTIVVCSVCGISFERSASNATRSIKKYKNIYCSIACRREASRTIEVICPNCGKAFFIDGYRVKNMKTDPCCSNYCRTALSMEAFFCSYCGRLTFKRRSLLNFARKEGQTEFYCSHYCWSCSYTKHNTEEEKINAKRISQEKDYIKHKDSYLKRAKNFRESEKGRLSARKSYYRNKHYREIVDIINSTKGEEKEYWEAFLEGAIEMSMAVTDVDKLIREKEK